MISRAALALVAVFSIHTAAPAATLVATWSGFVSSGADSVGAFGDIGTDLTGEPFTATFTYNTDGAAIFNGGAALAGGVGVFAPFGQLDQYASPGTALVTIAGTSVALEGDYASWLIISPDEFQLSSLVVPGLPSRFTLQINGGSTSFPDSLEAGFGPIALCADLPSIYCGGFMRLDESTFLRLQGTTVALTVSAPWYVGDNAGQVPEPSTWALLIGGFGAAGFCLRRQSRVRVVMRQR